MDLGDDGPLLAGVAHAVLVDVLLVRVVDVRAVVPEIRNAVLVPVRRRRGRRGRRRRRRRRRLLVREEVAVALVAAALHVQPFHVNAGEGGRGGGAGSAQRGALLHRTRRLRGGRGGG